MKSIVKTGKTIEEAVEAALAELGATKEDVSIHVLEEPTKGFLGIIGNKEAKVQIDVDKSPEVLADKFLREVVGKMGIVAVPEMSREGEYLKIDLVGENKHDMGLIIGKRGATLDSIQYLTSIVVNAKREGYVKILLDTENYRERRKETLESLAQKMASKAKRTGRNIKLEPMNPYERRIIHSALQGHDAVTTHSIGEGEYRRVVIELK
ncbi:MAG: protein jag [Tissierellales bacterium]|jgi:spoIIIJ-associated protein|nr:protein jag [Tissierellales bacterium]